MSTNRPAETRLPARQAVPVRGLQWELEMSLAPLIGRLLAELDGQSERIEHYRRILHAISDTPLATIEADDRLVRLRGLRDQSLEAIDRLQRLAATGSATR